MFSILSKLSHVQDTVQPRQAHHCSLPASSKGYIYIWSHIYIYKYTYILWCWWKIMRFSFTLWIDVLADFESSFEKKHGFLKSTGWAWPRPGHHGYKNPWEASPPWCLPRGWGKLLSRTSRGSGSPHPGSRAWSWWDSWCQNPPAPNSLFHRTKETAIWNEMAKQKNMESEKKSDILFATGFVLKGHRSSQFW